MNSFGGKSTISLRMQCWKSPTKRHLNLSLKKIGYPITIYGSSLKSQRLLSVPPTLTFKNLHFAHAVSFTLFVMYSEWKAIISLTAHLMGHRNEETMCSLLGRKYNFSPAVGEMCAWTSWKIISSSNASSCWYFACLTHSTLLKPFLVSRSATATLYDASHYNCQRMNTSPEFCSVP